MLRLLAVCDRSRALDQAPETEDDDATAAHLQGPKSWGLLLLSSVLVLLLMPQAARVTTRTPPLLRTAEADQGEGSRPVPGLATLLVTIVALTMSEAGQAASTWTLSIGIDELHKLVLLVLLLLVLSSIKGANLEAGRVRGVGAVSEKAFPLPLPA